MWNRYLTFALVVLLAIIVVWFLVTVGAPTLGKVFQTASPCHLQACPSSR